MKMIKLTQVYANQNKPLWLNPYDISFMEIRWTPDEKWTIIYTRGNVGSFGVVETPEEIIKLIKEE